MQLDLKLGRTQRDAALEAAEKHNRDFLQLMRERARSVCLARGEVTSDDLRAYAASKRFAPTSTSVWGLIFRAPGWRCTGYRPSELPSSHARTIKVWTWVGEEATE